VKKYRGKRKNKRRAEYVPILNVTIRL